MCVCLTSSFDTSTGLSVCLSIHTFVYLFYGKKQYIALRKKSFICYCHVAPPCASSLLDFFCCSFPLLSFFRNISIQVEMSTRTRFTLLSRGSNLLVKCFRFHRFFSQFRKILRNFKDSMSHS